MDTAPFTPEIFLEELQKIVVDCEPNCMICYNSIIQLSQHIRGSHSLSSSVSKVSIKDFPSQEKDQSSTPSCKLKENAVVPINPFGNIHSCNICGKIFVNRASLEKHRCTHAPSLAPGLTHVEPPPKSLNETNNHQLRRSSRKRKAVDTYNETETEDADLNLNEESISTFSTTVVPLENNFFNSDDTNTNCEPDLNDIDIKIEYPPCTPEDDPNSNLDDDGVNFDISAQYLEQDQSSEKEEPSPKRPRRETTTAKKGKLSSEVSDVDEHDDPDFVHDEGSDAETETKNSKPSKSKKKLNEEKSHACQHCDSYFSSIRYLRAHSTKSHQIEGQCQICTEQLSDSKELADHITSVHKDILEKLYECGVCNMGFCDSVQLDKHLREVHPTSLPYACETCGKKFSREADLRTHSVIHKLNEENPYICEHCDKTFISLTRIDDHVRVFHTKEKRYICQSCDASFYTKDSLSEHDTIHDEANQESHKSGSKIHRKKSKDSDHGGEEDRVSCGICKRMFSASSTLSDHLRKKHKDILGQRCVCKYCEERFFNNRSLVKHVRESHPGGKQFNCKICSRGFDKQGQLTLHSKNHAVVKKFACTDCGKTFLTPSHLRRHSQQHTGEKHHECDQCSKSFTSSHALVTHKRTHTGEKPFMCDVCSKSFNSKQKLKAHMAFHMEEGGVKVKPHVCEHCGKCFTTRTNLLTHLKSHTGGKPHMCDECGNCFTLPHQLRAHLKTHK